MRGATIRDKRDHLRADLIHRLSAAELEKFLHQLHPAAFAHRSARLLIYSHVPRATFKIDKFHGSHFLDLLATRPSLKVALVATHREVQLVQQYVEALARMKKANLRSFAADEAAALAWLVTPLPATKVAVRSSRGRPGNPRC
jgi:hypothetical protein